MEKIISDFIYVAISVGLVYLIAYFIGQEPDNIVGWVALGLAATSSKG